MLVDSAEGDSALRVNVAAESDRDAVKFDSLGEATVHEVYLANNAAYFTGDSVKLPRSF